MMSRSILLAEDNEDDVFFFKASARKAGWTYPVITCPDGRVAIEQLRKYCEGDAAVGQICLALLDLKMPFVGGLEVLDWARRQNVLRSVPMIVLTSSEQESDIATAYQLGAASYLVKPSQPDHLPALLKLIDAYWLGFNRLPSKQACEAVSPLVSTL